MDAGEVRRLNPEIPIWDAEVIAIIAGIVQEISDCLIEIHDALVGRGSGRCRTGDGICGVDNGVSAGATRSRTSTRAPRTSESGYPNGVGAGATYDGRADYEGATTIDTYYS